VAVPTALIMHRCDPVTNAATQLPSTGGTYILLMQLDTPTRLEIGRLGVFDFAPGWYAYVGSALGPGGLRARLNHHLKRAARPHWHIDYVRRVAQLRQVWYAVSEMRHEHIWAAALHGLAGASVPVRRFGASDCDCAAHLFYDDRLPDFEAFCAQIGPSLVVLRWENPPAR